MITPSPHGYRTPARNEHGVRGFSTDTLRSPENL